MKWPDLKGNVAQLMETLTLQEDFVQLLHDASLSLSIKWKRNVEISQERLKSDEACI